MIRFFTLFILFLLSILAHSTAISQESNTSNLYSQVVGVESSSLPDKLKLAALYQLKIKAEARHYTPDSGYIMMLIKVAKYESIVHKNYALAARYNMQALNCIKNTKQPIAEKIVVNAYYNHGAYCSKLLFYTKALAYYDTVAMMCQKHDPDNYMVDVYHDRAVVYFYTGDYQKVIDECTPGIKNALQLNLISYRIFFLNYRAISLLYEGELKQAVTDADTAIAVAEKNKSDVHCKYELATAYKIKAFICTKEEHYNKAEELLKSCIATRPHLQNDSGTVANDYNDLANLYLYRLSNYQKAKENYNTAIRYAKYCDTLMRNLMLFMEYTNLATVATRQQLYTDAIQNYNLASSYINVKTNNALLSTVAANQLTVISNKNVLFPLLFGKTELLLQLYKKTNQQAYLNACLRTALLTDTLINQTRHENLGENSKLYWRNETRNFFSSVIEACYLSNDAATAFRFIENSRAVLLNDKWNELNAASRLTKEEKNRLQNLQTNIIDAQQLLSTLKFNSDEYLQTESNLLNAKNKLDDYVRFLEKKHPAYAQYKYDDSELTLDSLQHYLAGNHQSFVHYFMNDTVMYVLGISANKTRFIKISQNEFNPKQLAVFLNLCTDKEKLKRGDNYQTLFAPLAQNIYNKLFKPLQLPKGEVAICTDNFLIPFEVLCTDNKGKKFLLNDYNFSYVYSAGTFVKPFVNSTTAAGNFIGFAPVSFAQHLNLVSLRQSADSLSQSASYYSHRTLFTETKATRSNFFKNASDYAIISVFSHAYADTTGREPVLYMQDAPIHLSELQLLKNPSARLVLLSACQTNIGKTATGEGIYSLARGFAITGIPSIAGTLWKADDQTIYTISAKFNEYLSKGWNKSEALRQAKLDFINSNPNSEYQLPYYWANLVLIGNTQPISLIKQDNNWLWMAFIILSSAILLAATVLLVKSNRYFKKRNTNTKQEQLMQV